MLPGGQRLVAICFAVSLSGGAYLPAQKNPSSTHRETGITELGRSTFNSSCAACHGLDGHGSDKGVNISGSAKLRQVTDAGLSELISNGVPGTGMPAFRTLSSSQLQAVVAYLRSLQGKSDTRTVSGDPKHGKEIFFGKGRCSSCHAISGEGGFLAPIFRASPTPRQPRQSTTRSPDAEECRKKAIVRRCSPHPRETALKA